MLETSTVGKIAVIGDPDSILAFKAIGAETFTAANVFEANDVLRKLSADGTYAVVFITEDIAELIPDTLAVLKTRAYPDVIPIPSSAGSTGYGLRSVKSDVEKAIGADILFNRED